MFLTWNAKGYLPPIDPRFNGASSQRSPYSVSMKDVVTKFSTSSERKNILSGLLHYRQALYTSGISTGFQWLNGSFMENVESNKSRPPNDIDVVTFFQIPDRQTQQEFLTHNRHLFDNSQTKPAYKVDAYPFVLGEPLQSYHAKQIAYWYSMWSHTRSQDWKGFLQVELDSDGDQECLSILNSASELSLTELGDSQ